MISCSHWGLFRLDCKQVLTEVLPFINNQISLEQFRDTGWADRVRAVLDIEE